MYMDQMVSVGKCANGFIVEARVKFKKEAKKTEKMSACCCPSEYAGSCEKQYLAKTIAEVGVLINDILPLLSDDFKDEDAFDEAFEAATKSEHKKGDMK